MHAQWSRPGPLFLVVAIGIGGGSCGGEEGDDPTSTPLSACSIEAPEPGPLHTDGTTLRDSLGRVVQLRGVNAGGRSKFAPYSPFTYEEGGFDAALAAYLDRAATWGITVLRVPFSWAAFEPVRGTDDAEWLARYEALVDGAWARGMWVVVDFHQDVYGEFYCGDGFPRWTVEDPGPDRHDCADWFTGYLGDDDVSAAFDRFWSDETSVQTAYHAMWGRMAGHFADHPGVVGYEVLNEPGWGTADRATWAATTLTDFYSDTAARVTAVDPDALILFDATGLDAVVGVTDLERPDGDNLVFAPHYYDPAVIAGAGQLTGDVTGALGAWMAQGEAWGVPVLLGEYGVDPDLAGGADYAEEHYAAFDALGMHGTWWQYSVSWEAWNFEDLDLVDGDGVEHAALVDVLARPVPRAVAGEPTFQSYVDGTLRLRWVPDGDGVTEITLPVRPTSDGEGWPGASAADIRGTGGCFDRREDRVYVRALSGAAEVEVEVGR